MKGLWNITWKIQIYNKPKYYVDLLIGLHEYKQQTNYYWTKNFFVRPQYTYYVLEMPVDYYSLICTDTVTLLPLFKMLLCFRNHINTSNCNISHYGIFKFSYKRKYLQSVLPVKELKDFLRRK